MVVGIYKITSPSGRVYIGQSRNIQKRFSGYKQDWFLKSDKQPRLRNSLNKYGVDSHIFEVTEICLIDDLDLKERYYQEIYDVLGVNGLNCVLVSSENKPHIRSIETRIKISKAHKGKKLSEETKNKIRLANIGKKQTNKTIEKRARKLKGYKHTSDFSSKISKRMSGGKNHRSKLILNTSTGIYYDTIRNAAEAINMKPKTLSSLLNGYSHNKTDMVFAI